jgi:thymidylate synthase ThyX
MNKIYTHPGQSQMQVEVILASRNAALPDEKPLVTLRMRYPRIIHGEVMTHRDFSRNARSSRAVPVRTMLLECTTMPFIPWHWLKNQAGMQGTIPLGPEEVELARQNWLKARDASVAVVQTLFDPEGLNIHKQNPNRLLEPFSWIDTLITSNRWDNFLWLRDHEAAEPHLQDLARLVKQALDEMEVQDLQPGQWHTPYITDDDVDHAMDISDTRDDFIAWICKISAARCARISYKPFDGDSSYEAELRRYDQLVTSDRVHASPTEHQATPDQFNYTGQYITDDRGVWDKPHLHGNLPGWIQARKLIPNECFYG